MFYKSLGRGTDDKRIRHIVCRYGAHNLVATMRPKHSELKILVADKISSLNSVPNNKKKGKTVIAKGILQATCTPSTTTVGVWRRKGRVSVILCMCFYSSDFRLFV